MKSDSLIPLVVDLDGTLIRSDLLFEAFLIYVFKNPFRIFKMFYWLFTEGRGYLKLQIEKNVSLNVSCMPWNVDVISWLKEEREKGRPLVLVTGAPHHYAKSVAHHLNLFSKVFGVTNTRRRLSGKNKARFLYQLYGYKNFDYIANSFIDEPIWKLARFCHIAYAFPYIIQKIQNQFDVIQIFPKIKPPFLDRLKKTFISMIQIIFDRVPWYYCVLQLFSFLSTLFYFRFFEGRFFDNLLAFHVFGACFLFFLCSWILGEAGHLYRDRIHKNKNLFLKVHPYCSVFFIPLFCVTLLYSLFFLKDFLWLGAFLFFILESLRFLFRFRSHVYEVFIVLYLGFYAGMLVI